MKIIKQICVSFLLITILVSCSSPKYIFYHSEAGIPENSKYIKSEFKLILKINENLPFGVIAAIDKDKSDKITNYYILLSESIDKYNNFGVEDFITPNNVMISIEKVKELLSVLENSIILQNQSISSYTKGKNIEYQVSKEHKIDRVSTNVEVWESDFRFILKCYERRNEAFVILGYMHSVNLSIPYSYYLDNKQVIEFKERLLSGLDELKILGLK